MVYKAGAKARLLPWSIFITIDPFTTDRKQIGNQNSEIRDDMTQVSPKTLDTEESDVPSNPRDSIMSPKSTSDTSFYSALTDVPSHPSSGDDSDRPVNSSVVSPQHSEPIKPSHEDSQTRKDTPPSPAPLIVLNSQGPVKAASEKRIFSSKGKATEPESATEKENRCTEDLRRTSLSSRTSWDHGPSSSSLARSSSSKDSQHIIETDKPAYFPYLAHSYPAKNLGSEEEPLVTPTYAKLNQDFCIPVVTIVRQGETTWNIRASSDLEKQEVMLREVESLKVKQARVVERFCIWDSEPPIVDA